MSNKILCTLPIYTHIIYVRGNRTIVVPLTPPFTAGEHDTSALATRHTCGQTRRRLFAAAAAAGGCRTVRRAMYLMLHR